MVRGCTCFFFFKQKTAYEMRISYWSSDVCSSDPPRFPPRTARRSRADRREAGQVSASFITPRDLLAIEPENPARLTIPEIQRRFGVCKQVASPCRDLAMRSPHDLDAQWQRLPDGAGRRYAWSASPPPVSSRQPHAQQPHTHRTVRHHTRGTPGDSPPVTPT